jgi:hypothetical protein
LSGIVAKAHQRTPVPGPAFLRLLARVTGVDVSAPGQPVSARLGQWIDWNRAVALSAALDGRLSAPADDAPVFDDADTGAACARVRRTLEEAIAERGPGARMPAAGAPPDYAPYRQQYLNLQRSMQASTGQLRGRLRDMLARHSAAAARLAEVDAVMEQALSPREQALLATVPNLLGEHFERLRAAAETSPDSVRGDWLPRFHHDIQSVLRAELDVRFHPIDGLLAALRTDPGTP